MPNKSSLLNQNSNSNGELEEALLIAARAGDTKEVMRLCEQGANIEATDNKGKTALYWAAGSFLHFTKELTEIVRYLCEQGANVDAANNIGETALHRAAVLDRTEIVRILCQQGANVDAANNIGETALHRAADSGRTEIVRILCQQGANKETKDDGGNTALHYAVGSFEDNTEIVRVLCEQGANIDAANNKGETALHVAALLGRTETVRVFLEAGADYRIQNNEGKTPFDIAANDDVRQLITHRMIRDSKKAPLEVAFSAHCNFEEPNKLAYPKDKEHTFDGTRYAMGIIAQLKNTHDTPNPIMHHILSYLPSMTGNKPAECMKIVANRKKPTQNIPVNGQSNDKKRNTQDKGSKSKRQRISVREIKALEINEFANVAPVRRRIN